MSDIVPPEFAEIAKNIGIQTRTDLEYWVRKCLAAETERDGLIAVIQKYQPAGSPPPGDAVMLAVWTVQTIAGERDALREQVRWIPVGEKLPAPGYRVMLYDEKSQYMMTGEFTHMGHDQRPMFEIYRAVDCAHVSRNFTHWRELPEPPRK